VNKILLLLLSAVVDTVVEVLLRRLQDRCNECGAEAVIAEKFAVAAISELIQKTIDEVPGIPAIVKMLLTNRGLVAGVAQMVNDAADNTVHRALEIVDEAKKSQ